jgi:hypothetical protein
MNLSEDINLYLPKYLSSESQRELFSEIKQFPNNIQKRLYSNLSNDDGDILQGDGLVRLPITNLPDTRIEQGPVMVLSNSCYINPDNRRFISPRVAYCPIIKFSRYIDALRKKPSLSEDKLRSHIDSIKRQEITSLFYTANGHGLRF